MTIPLTMRFKILERDGFRCRFCGRDAPESELEVDHIRSRKDGGTNEAENLAASCRDCNRGKGSKTATLSNTNYSIVGKFFHRKDEEGYVQYQGQVLGPAEPGYMLICYADWLVGQRAAGDSLVSLADLADGTWIFYDTAEECREAYEYFMVPRRPEIRDKDD